MRDPRALIVLACTLVCGACVVRQSTYDRSLRVLSKYQSERLRTEADRDTAIAEAAKLYEEQGRTLAETRRTAAVEKAGLEAEVAASRDELAAVREQRLLAEKRMEEWKKLTAKLADMVSAGKLKVSIRDGRMIVDLPSSVLFASGSAELQTAGKPTLSDVAKVLKEFPSRQFMVAGHTDNVPLGPAGAKFKDNWELSSARALTVTRFLIEQGIKPTKISTAGYGEFDPVGNNATDKGKQSNSRIEIVLMPNLSELPKLPNT